MTGTARPWTPNEYRSDGTLATIHVKRCCNGCGRQLGDPTDDEMNCAVAGARLPDVRSECPTCTPELGVPRPAVPRPG